MLKTRTLNPKSSSAQVKLLTVHLKLLTVNPIANPRLLAMRWRFQTPTAQIAAFQSAPRYEAAEFQPGFRVYGLGFRV